MACSIKGGMKSGKNKKTQFSRSSFKNIANQKNKATDEPNNADNGLLTANCKNNPDCYKPEFPDEFETPLFRGVKK